MRATSTAMSLPFDGKRVRGYEIEFGADGNRLGRKFGLEDGSILFVHESQMATENRAVRDQPRLARKAIGA